MADPPPLNVQYRAARKEISLDLARVESISLSESARLLKSPRKHRQLGV